MTHRNLLAVGLGLTVLAGGAGRATAQMAQMDKTPAPPAEKKVVRQRVVVIDDGKDDKAIESIGKNVPRGYLGVGLTDLTPELRTHFGAPEDSGVMISKVEAGSPAEKAGLKVGDIVTAMGGKAVDTSLDLRSRVRAGEDGAQTPLEIWRAGKVQTVTPTLERRNRPEFDLAPLFYKKQDGDRTILRLDGDELPEKLEGPFGLLPGQQLKHLRHEADLEKRLKDLEKRIHDLEHQLTKPH
ncbi:MAG TPA: PDZ domain-containing protein [Thermoanaerobaculia bacterium]|nr:PDZ domain-containing protein [Thermoanaerobaculia bacterium]